MKTFKNKEQKEDLLKKLAAYQALGVFVKGSGQTVNNIEDVEYKWLTTWKLDTIHKFSELYRIDDWYCSMVREIFRYLPDTDTSEFPYKAIEILQVGFDFNKAESAFHRGVLLKQLEEVKYVDIRKVVIQCADLFLAPLNKIDKKAMLAVKKAAEEEYYCALINCTREEVSAIELVNEVAETVLIEMRIVNSWLARSSETTDWIWVRNLLFECIKNN